MRRDENRPDSGFTLTEMLIVIVILGVLAAVVVFAVGGIGDRGSVAACRSDVKSLRTAQEAHFAKSTPRSYAADAQSLVDAGMLADVPTHEKGITTDSSGEVFVGGVEVGSDAANSPSVLCS